MENKKLNFLIQNQKYLKEIDLKSTQFLKKSHRLNKVKNIFKLSLILQIKLVKIEGKIMQEQALF